MDRRATLTRGRRRRSRSRMWSDNYRPPVVTLADLLGGNRMIDEIDPTETPASPAGKLQDKKPEKRKAPTRPSTPARRKPASSDDLTPTEPVKRV